MDMNLIGNAALSFVSNHQQFVYGALIGAIVTHPGTCAVLVFKGVVRIPGVGPWIARNPDKAKGWASEFDKAIEECIDKYAKENAPAAPPQSPAA